ncbi:MAG TPA: SRPBCC family protein [Pedococcus sp.]|nr:SRPBCC family protein [Pedococcus sp.]
MRIERTVTTPTPLPTVFAYLSDFTTTTEWDPGTVRTVRESGNGGPGTRYRNTSQFAGRETELVYVVERLEENRVIALRGENATVVAHDEMTFRALGPDDLGGTEVTYVADFDFKGLTRFIAPLLAPALKKLGDEAERGMREALDRL